MIDDRQERVARFVATVAKHFGTPVTVTHRNVEARGIEAAPMDAHASAPTRASGFKVQRVRTGNDDIDDAYVRVVCNVCRMSWYAPRAERRRAKGYNEVFKEHAATHAAPEVRRDNHGNGDASRLNGRGPMENGGSDMGIGKRAPAFMPSAKWDAKTGRFFVFNRVRVNGEWVTEKNDVTEDFAAVFDLPNVETGWIRFPEKAAPETKLSPAAEDKDLGPPPTKDHKQGVRVIVKILSFDDDAGPREILSTSAAFWNAIDALHDEYQAGVADHPNQLPVAVLESVQVTETQNGTAHQPIFSIQEWTPRPPDMPKILAPRAQPQRKDDMGDEIPF
jgi:hypothetical protein